MRIEFQFSTWMAISSAIYLTLLHWSRCSFGKVTRCDCKPRKMSFPLLSFDSKRSHNRPKLFNTSIQQFNWNELSDKDVIGSGSFGSVITAKYNGKSIVVKQLLEQHERNLRLFYKEANILHSLDDKRIVKLHAVCQSPPAMMLELARTSTPIDQRGVWHNQARVIPRKQPVSHCTRRFIIMKICLN